MLLDMSFNFVFPEIFLILCITNGNGYSAEGSSECGVEHCKKCTQAKAIPTGCEDGYRLDSNYKCDDCGNNCKKCELKNGQYNCIECLDFYYKNDGQFCDQTCSNLGCIKCSKVGCEKCDKGLYLVDAFNCTQCPKNCAECQPDTQECTQCPDGYALLGATNRICVDVCSENCRECILNTKLDKYTCQKCNSGYYVTEDLFCSACGDHCERCSMKAGSLVCDECKRGFYMNVFGGCSDCEFDKSTKVISCMREPPTCIECDDTFNPGTDGHSCVKDVNSVCYVCEKDCPGEATKQHVTFCSGLGRTGSCQSSIKSNLEHLTNNSQITYSCNQELCGSDFIEQLVCRYDRTVSELVCTWCCEKTKCNLKPPAGLTVTKDDLNKIIDKMNGTSSGVAGLNLEPLDLAMEVIDILILWLVLILLTRKL